MDGPTNQDDLALKQNPVLETVKDAIVEKINGGEVVEEEHHDRIVV